MNTTLRQQPFLLHTFPAFSVNADISITKHVSFQNLPSSAKCALRSATCIVNTTVDDWGSESPHISVKFHHATQRHIPEDRIFYNYFRENP
jgi:hypothetical protein